MATRKIVRYPKIRIRQVRSAIGGTKRQRAVLESLGLKKMNMEVVKDANPAIKGMINAIPHLLEVKEES